jgi:hypothetical protein
MQIFSTDQLIGSVENNGLKKSGGKKMAPKKIIAENQS